MNIVKVSGVPVKEKKNKIIIISITKTFELYQMALMNEKKLKIPFQTDMMFDVNLVVGQIVHLFFIKLGF